MPILAVRRSRVALIIGSALCAFHPLSMPALAQGDDAAKKGTKEETVITDKNRDKVRLTPDQQGVVDKLIRLPETVNVAYATHGQDRTGLHLEREGRRVW